MNSDLLQKKEYLVGITIIEARNIYGDNNNAIAFDPFVKIICAD